MAALGPEDALLGPDAGLFSANNLGPLSTTAYALGEHALDSPGALTGHRPMTGRIVLTVITDEDKIPAVVAVVKEHGGSI